MKELVFFLEEESAKALLEKLVQRMQPAREPVPCRFVVFEGKQDLQQNLARKIRCYRNPAAHFFVLQDQDRSDCLELKKRLRAICAGAGRPDTKVRIACRELESFYLGDLAAVEKALGTRGLAKRQGREKFRDPDRLQNPANELEHLTSYNYQKVAGSRAIGEHLDLWNSRSKSYLCLVQSIHAVLQV